MKSGEVYILEDDAAVRATLSLVLAKANYKATCFVDGDTLIASARQKYPLCILLDVQLPEKSGLEVLAELRNRNYPSPVIMISGHGSIEIAVEALKSGAADLIEKPFRAEDLLVRIGRAIAGATADRDRAAARLVINPINLSGWQVLTSREQEVLRELLAGGSNKDIGLRLGLSPRTVESHRANIMKKAHVKNTTQLVLSILRSIFDSTYPHPGSLLAS